jgi:hypothetical protein
MISLFQLLIELKTSSTVLIEDSPYLDVECIRVLKERIYVSKVKREIEVSFFTYDGEGDLPAGFFHFERGIYLNVKKLHDWEASEQDVQYVLCHEYWHWLQALNGFPFRGEATPEEIEYYTRSLPSWEAGEYLTEDPSEMGAELFCALLGYRKSYFNSISNGAVDLLLKDFYNSVVMSNELYKEEWERMNTI